MGDRVEYTSRIWWTHTQRMDEFHLEPDRSKYAIKHTFTYSHWFMWTFQIYLIFVYKLFSCISYNFSNCWFPLIYEQFIEFHFKARIFHLSTNWPSSWTQSDRAHGNLTSINSISSDFDRLMCACLCVFDSFDEVEIPNAQTYWYINHAIETNNNIYILRHTDRARKFTQIEQFRMNALAHWTFRIEKPTLSIFCKILRSSNWIRMKWYFFKSFFIDIIEDNWIHIDIKLV